jgi:hypothetical protein
MLRNILYSYKYARWLQRSERGASVVLRLAVSFALPLVMWETFRELLSLEQAAIPACYGIDRKTIACR